MNMHLIPEDGQADGAAARAIADFRAFLTKAAADGSINMAVDPRIGDAAKMPFLGADQTAAAFDGWMDTNVCKEQRDYMRADARVRAIQQVAPEVVKGHLRKGQHALAARAELSRKHELNVLLGKVGPDGKTRAGGELAALQAKWDAKQTAWKAERAAALSMSNASGAVERVGPRLDPLTQQLELERVYAEKQPAPQVGGEWERDETAGCWLHKFMEPAQPAPLPEGVTPEYALAAPPRLVAEVAALMERGLIFPVGGVTTDTADPTLQRVTT